LKKYQLNEGKKLLNQQKPPHGQFLTIKGGKPFILSRLHFQPFFWLIKELKKGVIFKILYYLFVEMPYLGPPI
jgi:hypothetical protein